MPSCLSRLQHFSLKFPQMRFQCSPPNPTHYIPYSFLDAAVTNYHKLADLKEQKCILSLLEARSWKSRRAMLPLGALEENLLLISSNFWWCQNSLAFLACHPPHHCNLSSSSHCFVLFVYLIFCASVSFKHVCHWI